MESERIPKVFISYSHDDENHKKWALKIADWLTLNGVHVIFDQYDLRVGKDMIYFMETGVKDADFVFCILTPGYKNKAEKRIGGVGYETSIITGEMYRNYNSGKFIPITRNGTPEECIPNYFSSILNLDMNDDELFEGNCLSLLRILYNEPEVVRPQIGQRPQFRNLDPRIIVSSALAGLSPISQSIISQLDKETESDFRKLASAAKIDGAIFLLSGDKELKSIGLNYGKLMDLAALRLLRIEQNQVAEFKIDPRTPVVFFGEEEGYRRIGYFKTTYESLKKLDGQPVWSTAVYSLTKFGLEIKRALSIKLDPNYMNTWEKEHESEFLFEDQIVIPAKDSAGKDWLITNLDQIKQRALEICPIPILT